MLNRIWQKSYGKISCSWEGLNKVLNQNSLTSCATSSKPTPGEVRQTVNHVITLIGRHQIENGNDFQMTIAILGPQESAPYFYYYW